MHEKRLKIVWLDGPGLDALHRGRVRLCDVSRAGAVWPDGSRTVSFSTAARPGLVAVKVRRADWPAVAEATVIPTVPVAELLTARGT